MLECGNGEGFGWVAVMVDVIIVVVISIVVVVIVGIDGAMVLMIGKCVIGDIRLINRSNGVVLELTLFMPLLLLLLLWVMR